MRFGFVAAGRRVWNLGNDVAQGDRTVERRRGLWKLKLATPPALETNCKVPEAPLVVPLMLSKAVLKVRVKVMDVKLAAPLSVIGMPAPVAFGTRMLAALLGPRAKSGMLRITVGVEATVKFATKLLPGAGIGAVELDAA